MVVHGQKQFSIVPSIGLSVPFFYSVEPPAGDSGFGVNTFSEGPSFNINFQYNPNHRWFLFAGWQVADNTSFGLTYGDPSRDLWRGRFTTSIGTHRIPVGAGRYVATCKWLRLHKREGALMRLDKRAVDNDMIYLLLFRFNVIGGVSVNYVNGQQDARGFSRGTLDYTITQSPNVSLFTGIQLQFFHLGKDRLQLSMIYSQGLQTVGECDFTYSLPSGTYSAKVGTRGSNLTLQLGYPIRLSNHDKKEKM
ncbi:MAG: hypothetical protein MUC38_12750 [Cyclobacteriaceae bacterium]|nr:hypothetical protein [Cyclobacteriaceae bacterium]